MSGVKLDRLVVLLVVVAAVSFVVVSCSLFYYYRVYSFGSIRTVGISAYLDPELSIPATTLSWGDLYAGGGSTVDLYLVNNGSVPVTLSCYAENFSPADAVYVLALGWDYDGSQIDCGGVAAVTLALSVSVEPLGIREFSFDVVIVAVEVPGNLH